MKNKKIIIGSRGSKLALIYAKRARTELLKNSEIENIDIKSITTTGDTITDVRLSGTNGPITDIGLSYRGGRQK